MRKLILSCSCGQRMQVPRSAIGRTGLCPSCGTAVPITAENTTQASVRGAGPDTAPPPGGGGGGWSGARQSPTEDAKRKFGEAVDLYYRRHYAEALAIFNGLARQFPGNAEIERGRDQCLAALRGAGGYQESFSPESYLSLPGDGAKPNGQLDESAVRRVVVDKLLHSVSEPVQLQAAELACKLLGLLEGGAPRPSSDTSDAEGRTGSAAPIHSVKNGEDGFISYPRSIHKP
ncbi:MAG: hypothetical protein R6W89_08145 [Candidatus Hydrogenedentota bacterium]